MTNDEILHDGTGPMVSNARIGYYSGNLQHGTYGDLEAVTKNGTTVVLEYEFLKLEDN